MKVKEESEKTCLKLNIQKTKIMAFGPIISWQIDEETVETVTDFIFEELQNHCGAYCMDAFHSFERNMVLCLFWSRK